MTTEAKVSLTLTADALAILVRQASPRKRGEFVSKLLIQYSAVDSGIDTVDIESMKLMILGLAGANKSLEARVIRLERQVAALIGGR